MDPNVSPFETRVTNLEASDDISKIEQIVFPAGHRGGTQNLSYSGQKFTGSLHERIMNVNFQSRMVVVQHIWL